MPQLTKPVIKALKAALKKNLILFFFFDLETSYMLVRIWRFGKNYITHKQQVKGTEPKIISAQYHYNFDKTKYLMWKKTKKGFSDKKLLKQFLEIATKADIVIGQNVKEFDIKTLQERIKLHKLPAFRADFVLDILKLSQGSFNTPSHKLDYRSEQQGLGGKHNMEMKDWEDVVEHNVSPKKKMIPYGIKDDEDTGKLFWKELPYYNFSQAVINKIIALLKQRTGYIDKSFCSTCQKNRKSKFNLKVFRKGTKEYYRCLNCDSEWRA